MSFALFVYVVAQIADIATTNAALKRGAREANPLVDRLMGTFGFKWALAKFLISAGFAAALAYSGSTFGLYAVAAIIGAIAARNTTV